MHKTEQPHLVCGSSGKNEFTTRVERHRVDFTLVSSDVVGGTVLASVPTMIKSMKSASECT